MFLHQCVLDLLTSKGSSQPICFVNYSALQKMDSLDAMEGKETQIVSKLFFHSRCIDLSD